MVRDVNVTGIVAALRAEARCLGAARGQWPKLRVQISGVGCERAARSAQQLLQQGAQALLCFGIGGALDPQLRCGDIVLASEVLSDAPEGTPLRGCADWRRQLETALQQVGSVRTGAVLTCSELVCSVARKRELFARTGASVVDMESAAVALAASRHGVPFMSLRVVADTATDALPIMLQRAFGSGSKGAVAGALWWSLLRAPESWPALARLARRYRVARGVLGRCARVGVARELQPAAALPA